jgi:hypothetical protein
MLGTQEQFPADYRQTKMLLVSFDRQVLPGTFEYTLNYLIDEYSRRLGIIEPVFGHIRHARKLNRFTLRGKRKVNGQWLMYSLVHNIAKLQRYGPAVIG